MENFYINTETCSKCGVCSEICPAFVIEKKNSEQPKFKTDYQHLCLGCGQCMAVCKTKSIVAKGLNYEKDFYEFSEGDDFFTMLEKRRSVRRFKPKALSNEEIEKILDAISKAPHGDSHQHVEITVINGRDKLMEALPLMSKFYDKLEKWLANPLMRTIIRLKKGKHTINTLVNHVLPRIKKGIYREYSLEYDGITRGAHTIFLFHAPSDAEEHIEDSMIFVAYGILAAQAMGLGATIVGLVPAALNKSKELKKLFNIPENHNTVTSMIVGYPKYKYHRAIKRNLKNIQFLN